MGGKKHKGTVDVEKKKTKETKKKKSYKQAYN